MKRSLLVLILTLALAAPAGAATFGANDTSFSGDGWASLAAGHAYYAEATDVTLRADRTIISGGLAEVGDRLDFAVTSHEPGGGIDSAFGGGDGNVTTAVGNGGNAKIVSVLALGGDRTLAIGSAVHNGAPRIALVRYTASGGLDGAFGSGGTLVLPPLADGAEPLDAALAADGDVLITGKLTVGAEYRPFLLRLNPDGSRDGASGTDGLSSFSLTVKNCLDGARNVIPRPDGSTVLVGSCFSPAGGFVLRLGRDGKRDCTFGTSGAVFTPPDLSVRAGIVDHLGRYVLVGGAGGGFAARRLTAAGAPDTTFGGGDGLADGIQDDYDALGTATDVDELADGRLWLTGSASNGTSPVQSLWAAALIGASGDPAAGYAKYDGIGYTLTSQPGESAAEGIVDGNTLIQAGRAANAPYFEGVHEEFTFGVRRYTTTGARSPGLDSYATAGMRVGETQSVLPHAVRPQPGGAIYVAGDAIEGDQAVAGAFKLTGAGVPDPAWPSGGFAGGQVGTEDSGAYDVAPSASGTGVYLTGIARGPSLPYTMLVERRSAATGALDAGFAGDGVAFVRLGPTPNDGAAPVCGTLCRDDDGTKLSSGAGTRVLPLADGGVLVLGSAGFLNNPFRNVNARRIVLARLDANGDPVAAFGTNGVVQFYRSPGSDAPSPLAATITGGGTKVRVAAILTSGGPVEEVQFDLATGALDAGYDTDGVATVAGAPFGYSIGGARFTSSDDLALAGYATTASVTFGRFTGAAAPLGGFGTGGFATVSPLSLSFPGDGVDVLTDGRTITGVDRSTTVRPALTAVDGTGALSTDFGSGGVLTATQTCGRDDPADVAGDPSGRALLLTRGSGLYQFSFGSAGLARFTTGAPSAAALCAPTRGAVSQAGSGPYTCAPAGWDGSNLSFTYQWFRDATAIAGETGSSYAPASADAGHLIGCRVTGTNAAGSRSEIGSRRVPGTLYEPPAEGCSTAQPTPTPTPTPTPGGTPGPAGPSPSPGGSAPPPPPAAFETLSASLQILACAKTRVVLIDVLRAGRKVRLTGAATPSLFAGNTADILLGSKRVGRAKVGADGAIAKTLPAPKGGGRPRYMLRIGSESSSRVALDRRVVVDAISVKGGKVVIRGRVIGPQASKPAPIVFRRQTSCTTYAKAGSAKPTRSGRFTARLPLPSAPARAAVYRGQTKVAKGRGGKATSGSFTLARAVTIR